MAKVKLNGNKEIRMIKGNIMKYKTLENVKTKELAIAAGVSFKCMYSRLEKPEEFRIKELIKVAKKLNVSLAELLGE